MSCRVNILTAKSDIAQHVVVKAAQVQHLPSTIENVQRRMIDVNTVFTICTNVEVCPFIAGKCVVVILLVAVMSALL